MTSSPPIAETRVQPPPHLERCGSGAPVLLLHGWGASSALFQPILDGLQHAFTLVAPDFPGFGATPPPPAAWSVDDYAQWVVDVLDALSLGSVHVVGHSFGGRVAIKLATRWPDRIGKVVLTDAAGIRPPRTVGYWTRVYTFKSLRLLATTPLAPLALREWGRAWVERHGSSDYQQASGTVRGSFVRVVNEDLRTALPRIHVPTLLIWGDRDEDTPLADARVMERLIPDAGLVVFEGAGHYAYLEQPARFCRIVETFFAEAGA